MINPLHPKDIHFHPDVLLYVEDDVGFVDLFHCALQQGKFKHRVIHVSDGEEAITYFEGRGKYANRDVYPLPCLVLLDLKMPRVNGFEVLQWIRQKSPFPYLPVVVLTVSEEVRDVSKAYALGANSFLIKPPSVAELSQIMTNIDHYWFRHNISSRGINLR